MIKLRNSEGKTLSTAADQTIATALLRTVVLPKMLTRQSLHYGNFIGRKKIYAKELVQKNVYGSAPKNTVGKTLKRYTSYSSRDIVR